MQPGNLVFLVIVAIWAVYLVQHWIRRREHVATARSVDRFSEAMRVLERRTPMSRAELAAPHPPSYAVRPPSSRPALVVKRAPTVASSTGARMVGNGSGHPSSRPGPRSPRELLVRRARGVAFLVTLAAIPVTLVLAIADVLLWVSVAIAVAAFVVVVAGLRAAVKRDRSVRRAARTAARRRYAPATGSSAGPTSAGGGPTASPGARLHPKPGGGTAADSAGPPQPAEAAAEQPAEAALVSARHTDNVYDVTAYVARPGEPSTTPWSPVPVPPPTYTLKDAAARPIPEPAEVSQVPVPIEVEDDELERLMAQRHRRIVG